MNGVRWIRVAACEAIPPREGRPVHIGDREIAIFNLGPSTPLGTSDVFLATDNQCPHKGGPLCDGILSGRAVVCPLHGWKINLETGAIERPGGVACEGVRTYPLRVEAGIVAVAVPERAGEAEKFQNCHIVSV